MNDVYTDQEETLSNIVDSRTGKNIVLDLSNMTLPARRKLKLIGDAARDHGKRISIVKDKRI